MSFQSIETTVNYAWILLFSFKERRFTCATFEQRVSFVAQKILNFTLCTAKEFGNLKREQAILIFLCKISNRTKVKNTILYVEEEKIMSDVFFTRHYIYLELYLIYR